jgi:D-aminopeptidase
VNAVVGETNDGWLNDIRGMRVQEEHVAQALKNAKTGQVAEGTVGAGTGTSCLGFKGGIGTSSRILPKELGGYTVGVLVQTNFGGILTINGAPVGRELGRYSFQRETEGRGAGGDAGDGSIMMVVATDAPLAPSNLERLARRALFGLARTGATMSNGSGDYVIAFSTDSAVRRRAGVARHRLAELGNDAVSGLFQAVVEATEEAIYNSLLTATTERANGNTVEAIPAAEVVRILRERGALAR